MMSVAQTLQELDGARRADLEANDRKKDQKRQKLMKDLMLPQYLAQIHKLTDPTAQAARPKLHLPAPTVSDADLQELARISAMPQGGATPTTALLAQYGLTPQVGPTGSRTPLALPTPQRTASTGDQLLKDARTLVALNAMPTPLQGTFFCCAPSPHPRWRLQWLRSHSEFNVCVIVFCL